MRRVGVKVVFINFVLSDLYSKGGRDVNVVDKPARGCNIVITYCLVCEFALTSYSSVSLFSVYFYGRSFNRGCYDKECAVSFC